jgi:fucose 4-O-acetylase-like acetyltransferase
MRCQDIDALKGLAIILVVLGHAIVATSIQVGQGGGAELVSVGPTQWASAATMLDPLLNVLYAFHMPLFAFLSGFVLSLGVPRSLISEAGRKSLRLIVPYLAWTALVWMLWSPVRAVHPNPLNAAWDALTNAVSPGAPWYLWALATSSLVVLAIARLPYGRRVLGATGFIAALATAWPFPQSDSLAACLWVYPFIVLGYIVQPLELPEARRRLAVCAGLGVAFMALLVLRWPIVAVGPSPLALWIRSLPKPWLYGGTLVAVPFTRYGLATCGVLLCYLLYAGRKGVFVRMQAEIGRRSLGVYVAHQWLLLFPLALAGVRTVWLLFPAALAGSLLLTAGIDRVPVLRSVLLGEGWGRPGNVSSVVGPSLDDDDPSL